MPNKLKQPLLTSKSKVVIISTSAYYGTEREVQDIQAFLQATLNCQVEYSEECYRKFSVKERAANFLSHALDPTIDVLWALRGGEGSADLLPYIHPQLLNLVKLPPKTLIGFSDVTPLLVYFYQQLQWYCISAIVARQLVRTNSGEPISDISFDALRELLRHGVSPAISEIQPLNNAAKKSKHIGAHIIGGNLSMINISIKDLWQLQTKNKILLLEEVNEPAYRLIRTLKYFARIGLFSDVSAILLAGIYYDEHQAKRPDLFNQAITEALHDFARTQAKPVLYTPQISHGSVNLPVPFYLKAQLQLGENPTMTFS